ncbi:MAG TPA: c-type cytochrome [Rhodocyclaceae bacterium]|jgi:cytochrome c
MFSPRKLLCVLALLPVTQVALADDALDAKMSKLASAAGCFTCHSIESGKPGPNGMAPIGPAWQDVAKRYKGDKKAADTLVKTVQQGSNPYGSHWKDKVSGLAMPPNAVAINEADTKKLVAWILALK